MAKIRRIAARSIENENSRFGYDSAMGNPMRPLLILSLLLATVAPALAGDPFMDEQNEWRKKRDQRLRSETGWLTLVGLEWLQPGENRIGSGSGAAVALPAGKAPADAGSLVLEGQAVRLRPAAGAGLLVNGKPAGEQVLADDGAETPDVVALGDLSFFVIRRGDRFGVRVRDAKAKTLLEFRGMEYFPPDPGWRIEADWEAYDAPRDVKIPNVLGQVETMRAVGRVHFSVAGESLTLEPVLAEGEPPMLWFIFKDATSGKETYGAGRFLYAAMPKDGKVIVDFNKAYNPPCVFTPYATCPLPPKKNTLPVRVEAGEKSFGGH
jgi:uncharacterized protein (DUF1684 family)